MRSSGRSIGVDDDVVVRRRGRIGCAGSGRSTRGNAGASGGGGDSRTTVARGASTGGGGGGGAADSGGGAGGGTLPRGSGKSTSRGIVKSSRSSGLSQRTINASANRL